MDAKTNKIAVLVIGAPRSGTSAVAGALARAGINFGPETDFVDTTRERHNPKFYERQDVNDLNDRIFALFGRQFGGSFHPRESNFDSEDLEPLYAEAGMLLNKVFEDSDLIGLKDPRFCFTAPFWCRVLSESGYSVLPVIVCREACDSIASNQAVVKGSSLAAQTRLWVESNLAAFHFVRHLSPIVVSYDSVMEGDTSDIDEVISRLGLDGSARDRACNVFDGALRKHRDSSINLPDYASELNCELCRGKWPSADAYEKYCSILEIKEGPERVGHLRHLADGSESHADARGAAEARLEVFVSDAEQSRAGVPPRTVACSYQTSQWVDLRLPLGVVAEKARLRIDPAAMQGVVHIGSIRIVRQADGTPLWSAGDCSELSEIVPAGTCWSLPSHSGLRIFSWGGDPQLVLPESATGNGEDSLILEISINFDSGVQSVKTGLHNTRQALNDAHQAVRTMRNSLSWRITAPLRILYSVLGMFVRGLMAIRGISWSFLRPAVLKQIVFKVAHILRHHGVGTLFWMARSYIMGSGLSYKKWCDKNEPDSAQLENLRQREKSLPWRPLISVVMPTYNAEPVWFRKTIDSVLKQTYTNWELCVADDASTRFDIKPVLKEIEALDERISVVYRKKNEHICAATNSALSITEGEFVALLDHDDILAPHALQVVVELLQEHSDACIIYSDEDKIDDDGNRMDPYFKPDWNPDLIMAQNYISHLSVLRHQAVQKAGGFRMGYEGSQDWDLVLRVTERCQAEQILHVPQVLYHWRMVAGSTSLGVDQKDYTMVAAEKALKDALQRRGECAEVSKLPDCGYFRLKYCPPENVSVSIIIPTRNEFSLLRRCVESIRAKTLHSDYEIVIVDNNSDDPETIEYLQSLNSEERVRVLEYPYPFNYSAINNYAAKEANGDYLILLNNDTEVIAEGWLREMLSLGWRTGTGAVGAKLLYPNGTLQHAGCILGIMGVANHAFYRMSGSYPGYFGRAKLISNYSAVTAACLGIKKISYLEVGGFDEENLPVAFNDIDFCLRLLEHGYRNAYTPFAVLYHHEMVSRGRDRKPEADARFRREVAYMRERWGYLLDHDPAYNPNLTLATTDFSLAVKSRVSCN